MSVNLDDVKHKLIQKVSTCKTSASNLWNPNETFMTINGKSCKKKDDTIYWKPKENYSLNISGFNAAFRKTNATKQKTMGELSITALNKKPSQITKMINDNNLIIGDLIMSTK